jgi:site-specific DNA recombinase
MNEEIQLRVALYLRVSTDEQVEKYGLDSQRSAIDGFIKSKGTLEDGRPAMVLAGKLYEYVDEGISGTKKVDQRPAFSRLKEDILEAGEGKKPFDVVAVFKIDRFARKLSILLDILDFFEEKKIEFLSTTEAIDTSTPFGRAMLGIMGVIAELELDVIKERTQKGQEQAKLQGKLMGGHAKYGYQKDEEGFPIILEEEAKIVRKIFTLFTIEKLSPQAIADRLTELQILTPDASAVKLKKRKGIVHKKNELFFWRGEKVKEILADEFYTGINYYNKNKGNKKRPKSEWVLSGRRHKPIIYKQVFELSQQFLEEISSRKVINKRMEEERLYLLRGLLKCNECRKLTSPVESEMMSWTGDRKLLTREPLRYSHYYHCNRKNRKKFSIVCPVVPIPAEPIEEYMIDFIKRLLSDPQAVYEYQKSHIPNQLSMKQLEEDRGYYVGLLNELPQRKESLKEQHELGVIGTPELKEKLGEYNKKKEIYKKKIEEMDYQLSQISLSKGYVESLELYAEKYGKALQESLLDKQEQFNLIHSIVNQIVVYARPRKKGDKIAGRKKGDQLIPERVDIHLNLPQNLLRQLYSHEFGVKNDNV